MKGTYKMELCGGMAILKEQRKSMLHWSVSGKREEKERPLSIPVKHILNVL
jgi:hypothetical protein